MLLLVACDTPEQDGQQAADGMLEQFIGFLDQRVVASGGGTPQQRFDRMRNFLLEPRDYLQYSIAEAGDPSWYVLSVSPAELEIVVWAYGESASVIGGEGGRGRACARFHVAGSRLVSMRRPCPDGLPETG